MFRKTQVSAAELRERWFLGYADRQPDRQTDSQPASQTDRQTDRQTARQPDRQTDRKTDRLQTHGTLECIFSPNR